MADHRTIYAPVKWLFEAAVYFLRRFLVGVISIGPIPCHVAFIMDGNRRYAKVYNLPNDKGHRAGYENLMQLLKHCSEIGIKHVTAYAFSIDNFNRSVEEVQALMELFQEMISNMADPRCVIHKYGFRFRFVGDLNLINESLRTAIDEATKATSQNKQGVLSICIAYTSSDEITNAVRESCNVARSVAKGPMEKQENYGISLDEIEKRMYMAGVPEPDLLIRSSGATRLSNFLLWQTSNSLLHSTAAFWPEIGASNLVWALLKYQRSVWYLKKKDKLV